MVAPVSAAAEFSNLTKEMFQKKKEGKKDQLRCLMDESIFFFLEQDVEDFFSFCHSKSIRNEEFCREIPLCRRLPRV